VLITPDQKDFFYACVGHTKDRGFASVVGPSEEERKRRQEEEKIERVRKELEERQKKKKMEKEEEERKKKEEGKEKEKEKEKEKVKDKDKGKEEEKEKEKEREEKKDEPAKIDEPRIFTLHKTIFDTRVRRYRQQQISKLNQERLRTNAFPSVPTGNP